MRTAVKKEKTKTYPREIFAVCKTDNAGTDWDKERFAQSRLKIGTKIRVISADVGRTHTDVWLEDYQKPFNSVFFDFVDETGNEYDLYADDRFCNYILDRN